MEKIRIAGGFAVVIVGMKLLFLAIICVLVVQLVAAVIVERIR